MCAAGLCIKWTHFSVSVISKRNLLPDAWCRDIFADALIEKLFTYHNASSLPLDSKIFCCCYLPYIHPYFLLWWHIMLPGICLTPIKLKYHGLMTPSRFLQFTLYKYPLVTGFALQTAKYIYLFKEIVFSVLDLVAYIKCWGRYHLVSAIK